MSIAVRHLAPTLAAVVCSAALSTSVSASDSLATPITSEMETQLWPLQVEVQIVEVDAETDPLPVRRIVVPDGHRTTWSSAKMTAAGRRFFELDVVARHHPRDVVELEWDVVISRAPVEEMAVHEYVLHRLHFAGPVPKLGPKRLEIARSDIVSTMGEPITETVDIGSQTYEIRIFADSLRG